MSELFKIFWKFCRPHTIIGTSLQVLTAYFLVSWNSGAFQKNLILLALTWLSSVAVNIYVVGLNQIVDEKIDRVNKPFLPLASGELSRAGAWMITLSMGVIALLSSSMQGVYLFATISAVLLIGTLYSLPTVYWKGSPIAASLAISLARGLIANLGVFIHFHQCIFGNSNIPLAILAFSLFNFGFGVVISLMKDAPDLVGDKLYGVRTLAVRIGINAVFKLALRILTVIYFCLSLVAYLDLSIEGTLLLAIAHIFILTIIWSKARKINYGDGRSIYSYYMFIWKFFYLEFGLFSLAIVI